MLEQQEEAAEIADEIKRKLMDAMSKEGSDKQMIREQCRRQVSDLADALELTHDDRESLSLAIDKDENVAITLIDRYLENYLR
jgi:rRNA maturation endonuclease Nob1